MNNKKAVLCGLACSIVVIIIIGYFLPPKIDFNSRNTHWNGHSKLVDSYGPEGVSSLTELQTRIPPAQNATLLILGPSEDFSETEAESVGDFVEGGGRVVLADDFGTGNELLKELNVDVRFSQFLLRDPAFKIRESSLPKIFRFTDSDMFENVAPVVLNYASTITGPEPDSEIVARSSDRSYVQEDNSRLPSENTGSYPVICRVERDKGEIFLISDSSLFINSMIERENNEKLLVKLIGRRELYLDTSHWEKSPLVKFQNYLSGIYGFMDKPIVKYGLLLLIVLVISRAALGKRKKEPHKKDRKVKEVLKRHPEWEGDTLKKLEEERES